MSVRVYLIEDHSLLQRLTRELINKLFGLIVVGASRSGAEALVEIPRIQPNLVITDINLADSINGLDVVKELHHLLPNTPVMVLSSHQVSDYIHRALAAGARGYVVKGYPDQIEPSIRHILDGGIYLCPRCLETLGRPTTENSFSYKTSSEEERQQHYLEQTNRLLAQAQVNIAKQEAILADLTAKGYDTAQAEELLATFLLILQHMEERRTQLIAALSVIRNR